MSCGIQAAGEHLSGAPPSLGMSPAWAAWGVHAIPGSRAITDSHREESTSEIPREAGLATWGAGSPSRGTSCPVIVLAPVGAGGRGPASVLVRSGEPRRVLSEAQGARVGGRRGAGLGRPAAAFPRGSRPSRGSRCLSATDSPARGEQVRAAREPGRPGGRRRPRATAGTRERASRRDSSCRIRAGLTVLPRDRVP